MTPPEHSPQELLKRIAADGEAVAKLTTSHLEAIISAIADLQVRAASIPSAAIPSDFVLSIKRVQGGLQSVVVQYEAVAKAVDVSAVRQIQSSLARHDATRALLVTTSTFTAQAQKLAQSLTSKLQLVDGSRLVHWAREYARLQEEVAAHFAQCFRGLQLHELARAVGPELENDRLEDVAGESLPSPYRKTLITAEQIPFRALRSVLQDPRHLLSLSPREFEEFTAEILDSLGFREIILTPPSRDGGRDVIASHSVNGIPVAFYFECKRYAESNKVQLDTLRSLLGVVAHEATQSNIGVLVTTSSFTAGTRELIASEARLDGKDYHDLLGWIDEAKARRRFG